MEENKEILENTAIEQTEAVQTPENDAKPVDEKDFVSKKKLPKIKKEKKLRVKKLKNQLLLKRGGYSLAITALFLVAVIIVNVLIGALSNRFNLELDLSTDKVSTMDEENIKYIKALEQEVNITVCASKENYASYMLNYIQSAHSLSDDYTDYYEQTLKLIDKYAALNKKITVNYVDMYNDAAFDAIQQKYSNEGLQYGDVLVTTTAKVDGEDKERYKVVGFEDIYALAEDTSNSYYQMMGMSSKYISGNNVETAITSAIAYVLGTDTKKVVIFSGHSSADMSAYNEAYSKLLVDNNFEVETISNLPISNIDEDVDVIALLAPNSDLMESEINVIVDFLENDGNYGKGLVYFGSSVSPNLPNLYELLADWGITPAEGKLFMADEDYCVSGDPFTILTPASYSAVIVSANNQPFLVEDSTDDSSELTVSSVKTQGNTVIAPISANTSWSDYTEDDYGNYALIAQGVRKTYNEDNQEVSSMVLAFSSLDFITSAYTEEQSVYNKNITLSLSQAAVQAEDTGIEFVSKSITNESFSSQVTEGASNTIRVIFMILLPIILLALGIFIFIRRKNA